MIKKSCRFTLIILSFLQGSNCNLFLFKGFINISQQGTYTFFTKSNDGSRLKIGNKLIVNNDEEHGVIEKSGKIILAPGKYPIEVSYFQSGGSKTFTVLYEGPGIEKQQIPASALFLN